MPDLSNVAPGEPGIVRRTLRACGRHLRRFDAAAMAVLLIVLLIGIPSALIFKPLGAAGTPANMVGMVMFLWWLAARAVPRLGVAARGEPVRIAIGLLALAILFSYASAMIHGWGMPYGLQEKTAYNSGTLDLDLISQVTAKETSSADRGLLSLAAWAGIALLVADGLPSRRHLDRLLKALGIMGVFLALLGMLQYFFDVDLASYFHIPGLHANSDFGLVDVRTVRRVEGTAVHPIEYGVVLTAILPIVVSRAMYAPKGRRTMPWIGAGIIAAAIPMSVSRSAILALGVAGVIMFAGWTGRQRITGSIVLAVFAVGMKLMVHGLLGTIRSLFTNLGNDPSIQGRTEDYHVALQLIHEHLWFGRGFFTFIPALYRTFDNSYLLALVEIGVVGTAALLLLFLIGIFTARGARRMAQDPQGRDLGQALAASLASMMVSAVTFDLVSFPMAATLTFLLVGCSGALWRLNRADAERNAVRVPGRHDAVDPVGSREHAAV